MTELISNLNSLRGSVKRLCLFVCQINSNFPNKGEKELKLRNKNEVSQGVFQEILCSGAHLNDAVCFMHGIYIRVKIYSDFPVLTGLTGIHLK